MAEGSYRLDTDLSEAQLMADGLNFYIQQRDIYGRVGLGGLFSSPDTPSLTIGALLMRIRRLDILRDLLTPAQASQLDAIIAQNEAVRREWKAHYDAKMKREAISRLKSIQVFYQEAREGTAYAEGAYRPEALRRTIVQDIYAKMLEYDVTASDVNEIETGMNAIDSRLRPFVPPGEFIWSEILQTAYPKEPYWWLYIDRHARLGRSTP